MAVKKDKQHGPRLGCVARALFGISVFCSLMLAVAIVAMLLPQDLSTINGYGDGAQIGKARDLKAVMRESLQRGHEITLSEGEINRWIGQTLKVEQKGLLGSVVKIDGLGVRLRPDEAEIVIERSFRGFKSTQSMLLQVSVDADERVSSKEVILHGGPIAGFFPALKRGGRFGCLTVPQGYIHLVKPAFFQLGDVYQEELDMAFRKMQDIRIEQGQLVLTPRPSPLTQPTP
ncbi:MAG: hypothetical protein ACO3SO_10335 [Luteolibacter sp.]